MYAMLTLIIAHHSQKSTVICEEYRALTENFLFLGFTKGEKTAIMFRLSSRCTGGSMDRASDSGSDGWGFESLPVYQKEKGRLRPPFFFLARKGLEHLNPTARWAVGRWVGSHRHLNFLPPKREKMQTSPFRCTLRTVFRPWESPSGSKTRPVGVWIAVSHTWKQYVAHKDRLFDIPGRKTARSTAGCVTLWRNNGH